MGRKNKVSIISIICWSTALLFGLWGLIMLALINRLSPGYSYLLTVGAVMMFGWAFLLIWADRNHSHRKGVFFITGLIAGGLLFAQLYGYFIGALSEKITMITGALLFALMALLVLSYFITKQAGHPKKYNLEQQLF